MKCRKAIRILGDYLDGELSSEKEVSLRSHLSSCSSCEMKLKRLKEVGHLLKLRRDDDPSNAYLGRTLPDLKKLMEAPRRREAFRLAQPLRPIFRVAVATVIILVNAYLLNQYFKANAELEILRSDISMTNRLMEIQNEGILLLQRAIEVNLDSPVRADLHYQLGLSLFRIGNWERAMKVLSEVVDRYPGTEQAERARSLL